MKFKIALCVYVVACLLLEMNSTVAHAGDVSLLPSRNSSNKDTMIRTLIVNVPLESTDQYLKSIWAQTKSLDKLESNNAWNCLTQVWKYCDGMGCHYFTRFCWNVCKEEPLAFYLRYLSGDKGAINYYKLASLYDIATFRVIDKVDKSQFFSVLNRTKQEIRKYNKEHLINDTTTIKALDSYISDANKSLVNVN